MKNSIVTGIVALASGAATVTATATPAIPADPAIEARVKKYANISVDKKEFSPADMITISADVTNTGQRDGMEPVILYSSDLVASITPDVLRVRGFDKISLKPGETRKVSFTIKASDLAFVGYDGKWTLEKGNFEFTLGQCKVKAACTETKKWDTPNI